MRLLPTLLVLASCAHPALAQQQICRTTEHILRTLTTSYGETRQVMGVNAQSGVIFSFMGNTSTETWTLISTNTQGISCVIAEGKPFILYLEPPGEEG